MRSEEDQEDRSQKLSVEKTSAEKASPEFTGRADSASEHSHSANPSAVKFRVEKPLAAEAGNSRADVRTNSDTDTGDDLDSASQVPAKSVLSTKLDRLKSATLKAVHSRERLPQPLFWSLFHAEVDSIKHKRKKQRELLAAMYNVDWL